MKNSNALNNNIFPEEGNGNLTRAPAFDVWKQYANTGGADKERMVTIATWLLALSATAIGYAATQFVEFEPTVRLNEPEKAAALAVLGLFVSFLGTIIVLLFAG